MAVRLRLVRAELRMMHFHDRLDLWVVVHQAPGLLHADQPAHRGNAGLGELFLGGEEAAAWLLAQGAVQLDRGAGVQQLVEAARMIEQA